jgi:hypothetical protein
VKKEEWSKLAFTSILGVILSYAFVFLAALPIRYLRLNFGRKVFIASSVACGSGLVMFGLWQWAIVYLSISILIGLYRELEECRVSIFAAGAWAVGLTALSSSLILLAYTKLSGLGIKGFLLEKASPIYEQMKDMPRFQETSINTFLWYLPSGLVITLMLVLFVSLTVGRHTLHNEDSSAGLVQFRLPDWMIWFFIGALGLSFIPQEPYLAVHLALNLLVITLGAYFFQGLAVFTFFLDQLKIYGLWRLLAFFLVFFQMFIFISGLGILDYWFDFRSRPNKKPLTRNI